MAETSESAPAPRYEDIAEMIEHSAVRPDLTEEQVRIACEIARSYRIACVIVRPSDVDLAVRWMEGSGIPVGSLVSYPHGAETTSTKIAAVKDLLRRGVREIDTVINIGKMLSRQFTYVEMELTQMAQACHEQSATLKAAFENGYLPQDLKVIACRIAKRASLDFACTSTPEGPAPYSLEDVALMKRLLADRVRIKASGGVRTLAQVQALRALGVARVGTITTVPILESWKAELAAAKAT